MKKSKSQHKKRRSALTASFLKKTIPRRASSRILKEENREVRKMVKRRTKRAYFGRAKRRGHSRKSDNLKLGAVLVSAGIYGALREKLSLALAPVTSKIPLGSIGDEIGILALAYFLRKNKTIKPVATAAMYIEAARIGEAVVNGNAFGTSSNSNNTSGFTSMV